MKLLLHVYIFVMSSTLDMLPCDNIVRQTLLTKLYKEENRGSEYLNVWWTCASDASSTSLCGHCSYLIHMLLHIERLSCCNGKSLAQARKCNFFFFQIKGNLPSWQQRHCHLYVQERIDYIAN